MAKKKQQNQHIITGILVILALVIGIFIGTQYLGNNKAPGAEATVQLAENEQVELAMNNLEQNNYIFSDGSALPAGFSDCYKSCRRDGYPGLVCAAKCARTSGIDSEAVEELEYSYNVGPLAASFGFADSGATPDGVRSCYKECRDDGYPGLVCAAKCVRR